MVQNLSHKIFDMEKEKEAKKQFKPYNKRRDESGPSQPPTHSSFAMNLIEVGMEIFCTFHQKCHSERNFPRRINSMNLVMNKLLDSKLTKIVVEDKNIHGSEEAPEETIMVLLDCAHILGLENE